MAAAPRARRAERRNSQKLEISASAFRVICAQYSRHICFLHLPCATTSSSFSSPRRQSVGKKSSPHSSNDIGSSLPLSSHGLAPQEHADRRRSSTRRFDNRFPSDSASAVLSFGRFEPALLIVSDYRSSPNRRSPAPRFHPRMLALADSLRDGAIASNLNRLRRARYWPIGSSLFFVSRLLPLLPDGTLIGGGDLRGPICGDGTHGANWLQPLEYLSLISAVECLPGFYQPLPTPPPSSPFSL